MKKYFKIKIGYGNGDDKQISIDETELESAVYCFISNSKGVFRNGVCRGQDIISITEDWHKAMGWNPDHVMDGDDWNEIESKGIKSIYTGLIGQVKDKVQYLMETNQLALIGKNVDVSLPEKHNQVSEAAKMLAEKMKI